MKGIPQRVVYLFAGFLVFFSLGVFGFWYFGADLFSVLPGSSSCAG
jgi:hypothetical protein